jgi:hypothetical protein
MHRTPFAFLLLFFFVAPSMAHSQCSVVVQDTLLPGFNLQLTATPLSGVAPFTYTWTIQGGQGGNITPIYSSTTGDTVLVDASDLFANYGCVLISVCMQDSTGCTNCISDTAYTNAIVCYSAFDTAETQPGQLMIMLPNFVPQHVGFTLITWEENGQQQSAPLVNGIGFLNYNPSVYNASGYDVPVCVQTMFYNSGFFCISCDTLHISAADPNGIGWQEEAYYSIAPHPVSHTLNVRLAQPAAHAMLQLCNLNGQLLHTTTITSEAALDMQSYAAGVYVLQLHADGFTSARKIVRY